MRRPGRLLRVLGLIAAGLAAASAPRVVQAFLPVIAVPAYIEQIPREAQPLADFRAPAPMSPLPFRKPAEGGAHLKLFLTDRSLLDGEPVVGPRLSFKLPDEIRQVVHGRKTEMPPEVAEAVRLLRSEKPTQIGRSPARLAKPSATTDAAVRNAIDVLRGVRNSTDPKLEFQMPVDRDSLIGAVDESIAQLNRRIAQGLPTDRGALAGAPAEKPKTPIAQTAPDKGAGLIGAVDESIAKLNERIAQGLPTDRVALVGAPAEKPKNPIVQAVPDKGDGLIGAVDESIAKLNERIAKGLPTDRESLVGGRPVAPSSERNLSNDPVALAPLVVSSPIPVVDWSPESESRRDGEREGVTRAVASLLGKQPSLPPPANPPPAPPPIKNVPSAPEPNPVAQFVLIPPPVAPAEAVAEGEAECVRFGRSGRLLSPFRRIGGIHDDDGGRCATCSGGWRCAPGQKPCEPCEAHDGPLGRLFCNFYECLCCPDPCYEPQWRQVANASIFVDGARPVTQTEVRWNAARRGVFPDRSEYLWARADGGGRGPRPPAGRIAETRFDFDDLVVITETAKDKLSAIVETPYRAVSPETYAHGAGFGDIGIGTKTLLFDCELLQVSLMFKTYLPVGNAIKGVGPGHVTLEPSLLFALKLARETYLQGQFSEWIPIGGDPNYAGSILHTHFSLNHVIHRFGPDIPLVGTFETNTYSFQDGAYTDPVLGPFQKASDMTYVSIGPGLRLMFCDKLDIGFGAALAVTREHFAREYYRTSVRFRF